MKRAAAAAVTPLVRFVEWLFGPKAPGIDLTLGLLSGVWGGLMIVRPHVFDGATYGGMSWMPDVAWIAFFGLLAAIHILGMFFTDWRTMRYSACLFSAWIWTSVSVSLATVELIPGVGTYAIFGGMALCGALYLSGQPRKAD